jgi:adenylate cyclase
VLNSGEALLADNAYKDPRTQAGQSVAALSLRSVLCVPLSYRGKLLGVIYIDNRLRAGVFTEREKALLVAFANQAAVALENARLYDEMQRTLTEITQMKDLLDNVFASLGSGVMTANDANQISSFNDAAARILGRPDMQGHPLRAILPLISDEALDSVRGGHTVAVDGEVQREGHATHVKARLSPLKGSHGVTLLLDDVTQQYERDIALDTIKRYLPGSMVDNIEMIARLSRGGERRLITCMFVEVRSYASLPPELRPAERMELLNEYLGVAADCVQRGNGIIDKYMGNELMVLFNTQLNPMDDHAVQAIRTARAIRQSFVELYERKGITPEPHYYRIGINTGVATLGNVGSQRRRDFTAIGDNINLAKRLEENAAYGAIIISEDARVQIHPDHVADLQWQERDPLQVKGRQQLTRVYEVL